jgi:hypothetical protein
LYDSSGYWGPQAARHRRQSRVVLVAADMLAVGWDQPAYNHLSSPASAVAEEVAGG